MLGKVPSTFSCTKLPIQTNYLIPLMMTVPEEPINSSSATNSTVLIVGAGVAGTLLALECSRYGFKPTIIERNEASSPAGDFVSIGRSATKVLKHWPLLLADYDANSCEVDAIWRKHSGELIDGPRPLKWSIGRCVIRKQLQRMLEEAVGRQKIPIKFNTKVTSYFEDGDKAGVVLETGERLTADLVVACDGVHSRSWQIVNGKKHNIVDSGHAVYRSAVPKTHAFKDPAVAERFEAANPYMQFQLGPRSHALVFYDGNTVCWSLHHPANANTSSESWSATLDGKDAADQSLDHLSDWDPVIMSLIRDTPEKTVNDWLLLYRDPEPNWVSPKGLIVQCGDSAHAFLPTSANGATQASEDAVTLAACLRAGYDQSVGIKESVKVYNELRFKRTSTAQLMGVVHRQALHDMDWDAIKKNPGLLEHIGPGNWLALHDPEEYAHDNFSACLESLRNGKSFENTNLPPGHTYRPWTCEEIFAIERRNEKLKLDGDWF